MTLSETTLDPLNIPKHVAIIMDGNGRWAKQKGKNRIFGHRNALGAVRETIETAGKAGVKYLTLYAFSTENWNRPKTEISALMELLFSAISKEVKSLHENNIRIRTIGDISTLPESTRKSLEHAMAVTANNTSLNVILALSYSSRWEILKAVKSIATDVKNGELQIENINENLFNRHLATSDIPDPEILIRTSGEMRISNFLLWQISYAELFFLEKLWPDFRGSDLLQVLHQYQNRERRFGKTSEQVKVIQ